MDIIYINNELLVTLTNFNLDRLKELERKLDIILKSFNISNININVRNNDLNLELFDGLICKYKTQKKKLNLCFDKNYL